MHRSTFRNFVATLVATTLLAAGCTTTSDVRPFNPDALGQNETAPKGVVFSLPRTIIELKITYSEYTRNIWAADANGNPKKTDDKGNPIAPRRASVVRVDKPVELAAKTTPDPKMQFIFDPESLNGFTKATDISVDLSNAGLLKSTNVKVEDKSSVIVSNTLSSLVNLGKLAAVAGQDVVEFILVRDVVVTRLIDPSELPFRSVSGTSTVLAEYSDKDRAAKIFAQQQLTVPDVKVTLSSKADISRHLQARSNNFSNSNIKDLGGFPYRVGTPMNIAISVDGVEMAESSFLIAQASAVAVLPLTSKAFSDVTQALTFSDDSGTLIKFSQKSSSRGEALSTTFKDGTGTLLSGVLDTQQARIDKLKKDKDLIDAEIALAEARKKQADAQK